MDVENSQSPQKASVLLHAHRLDNNPSKLPAFRFGDLKRIHIGAASLLSPDPDSAVESSSPSSYATQGPPSSRQHSNSASSPNSSLPPISPSSPARRPSTSPGGSVTPLSGPDPILSQYQTATVCIPRPHERRLRRAPASRRSNGIETSTGPPPALSTQRSFAAEPVHPSAASTTEWALAQQELAQQLNALPVTPTDEYKPADTTPQTRGASKSLDESTLSRPRIPPIRAFRSSTIRASQAMNARLSRRYDSAEDQDIDRDRTLRALEGFSDHKRAEQSPSGSIEQHDETQAKNASDEDLFLNLARDDMTRKVNNADGDNLILNERRRSRIALASHRQSLPPVSTSYQQPAVPSMARRGSDLQGVSNASPRDEHQQQPERLAYRPFSRDRNTIVTPHPLGDLSKSRYAPSAPRSSTTTPRGPSGRELSFESQVSHTGRRPSIPDSNAGITSRTPSYRQSNLSYSAPRTYNSSPLVSRTMDADNETEVARAADGTESTTSTTAASTVWDELDDLKSRIRKLELTGKLPATSGAAVSNATGDRPPTATTTNTTMSTSPKRGRGYSTSPIELSETASPFGETHPLLHSALAKSKPFLSVEVYKALEAAAMDALTIAAAMGSVGQPGPMSSAQSVIGSGASTVTDRQLRRKADSMCRSLTELCLALSDSPPPQSHSQALIRPGSRDKEYTNGASDPVQRLPNGTADSLTRLKSSPRALTRLEARRSSLLANSSLPSPRSAPSEVVTPTQSSMAGRRTSLLMRNRRAGTDDLDDGEEAQFRAPSRAATEIGRVENSPREYTSQHILPEPRTPTAISSLPVRRHYVSTSLTSGIPTNPAIANLGSRRYLDRSTPDRDTSSSINRLSEDRGQSQLAGQLSDGRGLGRTGSLVERRTAKRNNTDSSTAVQVGSYQ